VSEDRRSTVILRLLPLLVGVALALEVASAQAPTPSESAPSPNILLLVSEDHGPELGCYGDPHARTPRIDRLASQGVRFGRAFVPYSVCSPSRAAFLTGLHPQQNGQIGLATHRFAMTRGHATLPALLQGAGYRTGRIGKLHVNPASDFPFDFERYPGSNFQQRRVSEFAAAAREFFESCEGPFFLSVNFPDAHFPLIRQQEGLPRTPHGPEEVRPLPWVGADSSRLRQATADYYSCLARLDEGVGRILDELEAAGLAQSTLVLFLSDHGAQFSRGKTSCYEAGLRVPFLLRWPGVAQEGVVRDELVSTLDIVPTVCEAVGIELPPKLTGRALQPLLAAAEVEDWRQHVFAMGTGSAPSLGWLQFAVRSERYKLIVNPWSGSENRCARAYLEQRNAHFVAGTDEAELEEAPEHVRDAYATWLRPPAVELYDLEDDPNEWLDRADDPALAEVRGRLLHELEAFRRSIADPFLDPLVLERFTGEQTAALTHPYRREPGFSWTYLTDFESVGVGRGLGRLTLDPLFDHHMVLPREAPIPVWGTAGAGEEIVVTFGGRSARTRSDRSGHWRVELAAEAAHTTPRSLVVDGGGERVRLLDVVVGDVWLCAGQSNMAFPLSRSSAAEAALEGAERAHLRLWNRIPRLHPGGRSFSVELLKSIDSAALYSASRWGRSDRSTAAPFSAVGWHFGARVSEELGVPVGLVNVAVGGSPVEAWLELEHGTREAGLLPLLEDWLDNTAYPAWCRERARLNLRHGLEAGLESLHHPFEPGFLFAAGVRPLLDFPVRGVLWYQGESNATVDGGQGRPVAVDLNARKLRALVAGWRAAFEAPELPFCMVQLPGLNREWPAFREAQARVAAHDPRVHLAATLDLGHSTDVHPKRKAAVGERLARLALAHEYGQALVAGGPELDHVALGPGATCRVRMTRSAGLRTSDGESPRCFAVAGKDGRFYPARAHIEGEEVVLDCASVESVVAVRYAYENDPAVNLVNGAGLPAAPFRTDTGPLPAQVRVACIGTGVPPGSDFEGIDSLAQRLGALLGPDFAVRSFASSDGDPLRPGSEEQALREYVGSAAHQAALSWEPDVVLCSLVLGDAELPRGLSALGDSFKGLQTSPQILLFAASAADEEPVEALAELIRRGRLH